MSDSQREQVREEDFRVNLNSYHYQIYLLLHFLWRGFKNEYDFQLETESKEAEKFDDLVFSYKEKGIKYVTYLQAKYSKNESKRWKYQDFAADRNIAIGNFMKYFISFRKIKQKLCDKYAENFVLCSNIRFDSLKLKNGEGGILEFLETTEDVKLIVNGKNIKKEMFHGFKNYAQWKTYRINNFSTEIYEKLLKATNLSILAEELANAIIDRRKTSDTNTIELDMENFWFSKYYKALVNENVIEMNQEIVTFSSWFTKFNDKERKVDKINLLDDPNSEINLLKFQKMFKDEYEKITSVSMKNVIFNKEVLHFYNSNRKSKSNELKLKNMELLKALILSLVKLAVDGNYMLDDIIKENFDIVKKVLVITKRNAFSDKFVNGENMEEKVIEFRNLLLQRLEKNSMERIESETFITTEDFYEKFQSEQNLNNFPVGNLPEAIAEYLVSKKTITEEIISGENLSVLKCVFDSTEANHVRLKNNFIQNLHLTSNAKCFRAQLFQSYLKKLLTVKEITFKFNVSQMDNLVLKIKNIITNKERTEFFDATSGGNKAKNLMKSLIGFVFEKVDEQSNTIKFKDNFFINNDACEEITLLKAKLKKKLKIKDLSSLKEFKYEMPDFTCISPSLKENEYIEEEIDEFRKKFLIVTSPNENELIDCVKEEIGAHYDFWTAVSANEKLYRKIIDFAKGIDGQYLTFPIIKEFLNDVVTLTKVQEMAVLTSQYCNALKSYRVLFQQNHCINLMKSVIYNYQNPIKQLKEQWFYYKTEETILTAIKIEQALQKISYLQNKFIFLPLSSLLKSLESTFAAFESVYIQMIVIVEDTVPSECFCKKFFSIIQKNEEKQLVLISKRESLLTDFIKKYVEEHFLTEVYNYKTEYDLEFFVHLTEETQSALLKKKIKFNNKDITLNELISDHVFYNTISGRILMQILNDENITIMQAKEVPTAKQEEYYIERNVNLVEFNDELFKEKNQMKNHYFAIEGENESDVRTFLTTKNVNAKKMCIASEFSEKEKEIYFVILNSEDAKKDFKRVFGYDKFIHWLKLRKERLIWFQSKLPVRYTSSLTTLLNFCIKKKSVTMKENDFFINTGSNQTVVICDAPGMGKSTILNILEKEQERNFSWPVRINLNEYTKFLSDLQSEIKWHRSKAKFDFGYFNNKITNYSELILRTFFIYTTIISTFDSIIIKVVILFDGFDEISPIYSDDILKILQRIKRETKNQIWVTSRPNFKLTLEAELGVFAYTLEPFSKISQIKYLTNVWKQQWYRGLNDLICSGINKYSSRLIEQFHNFIGEDSIAFMGIPLKMKMMAEIFKENEKSYKKDQWLGCFDYLNSLTLENANECDTKISTENMNMYVLYDLFIKKKFRRFLNEKINVDITAHYGLNIKKILYDYQYDAHSVLSFLQLINEHKDKHATEIDFLIREKKKNLIKEWMQNFNNGSENIGIISKVIDEHPIFEHLTYAEYFCANFLMDHLQNIPEHKQHIFKLLDTILENNVPVFHFCITHLMEHKIGFAKLNTIFEGTPVIVFSVRHGFVNCVKCFITKDKFKNGFPNGDKDARTLLHHAVLCQQMPMIIQILLQASLLLQDSQTPQTSLLFEFIDVLDNDGKNAIDYKSDNITISNMLEDLRDSIVKCVILESGKHFAGNAWVDVEFEYLFWQKILQFAACETIENFINNVHHIVAYDLDNATPFNFYDGIAARNDLTEEEKLKIFKLLWIKAINDGEKALIAELILFAAIENECSRLFKSFFSFLIKECRVSKELFSTCINLVFNLKKMSIFYFLCEMQYNPNAFWIVLKDKSSSTMLKHLNETHKIRISCGLKDFLAIIKERKHNIIKYVFKNIDKIEVAYDLNIIWESVIRTNDDFVIKAMLQIGRLSEFTSCSIKEYYETNDYNVNQKVDGKSLLHCAVKNGDPILILFLLKKGADVNITDNFGQTALHYACEDDFLEGAQCLLSYGAIYDNKDDKGNEPICYCKKNSHIFKMLTMLKDEFSGQRAKESIKRYIWTNTHMKIFISNELKIEPDVLTNATNKYNETLWHTAAESRDINKLNELHQSKFAVSMINQKTLYGNTALHIASENGFRDIVLLLLKYGAYYNLTNAKNETAAEVAQTKRQKSVVKLFKRIERIFNAVKTGMLEAVKNEFNTFDKSLIVKIKDNTGKNLLHYAINLKCLKLVQYLLDNDTNVNSRDLDNHSPIYYAAKFNDFLILKELILKKARMRKDEFETIEENQCVCLLKQINQHFKYFHNEDFNSISLAMELLAFNEYKNLVLCANDCHGKNLLDYALEMNNYVIVVKLLENGAVLNDYNAFFLRIEQKSKPCSTRFF